MEGWGEELVAACLSVSRGLWRVDFEEMRVETVKTFGEKLPVRGKRHHRTSELGSGLSRPRDKKGASLIGREVTEGERDLCEQIPQGRVGLCQDGLLLGLTGVIGRFWTEDGQNLMCVLSGSLATPSDLGGVLVC